MESNKNLNWSLILKLKELSDYLSIIELKGICLNKTIRSSLKQYIFKESKLSNFKFKNNNEFIDNVDESSSSESQAHLKKLNQEFSSIESYTRKLIVSDNFNHNALLNYSFKFPVLKRLTLDNIDLPLYIFNQLLENFKNLEYVNLMNVGLAISNNSNKESRINFPKYLKTLIIYGLELIVNSRICNLSYSPTNSEPSLFQNIRQNYTFKPQNLPKIKNIILLNKSTEVVDNLVFFLENNSQSINFCFISVINFNSRIFSLINNCPNLTRLHLDNSISRFDDSPIEEEYTKFNNIKHLIYKPNYTNYILLDKSLLLSFPNLTYLECCYEYYFKDDLVSVVEALHKLEKLTLINWKMKYNFNFIITSNSLKSITLQNSSIMEFKPIIADKCPKVNLISLIAYGLNGFDIEGVNAKFNQFSNWKTLIFEDVIRMYSTSNC